MSDHDDDTPTAEQPRCIGCHRPLVSGEEQTCEDRPGENGRGCVQRGRELLSGILACWVDLHGETHVWPRTAMLADGGSGDMPRRLNQLEQTRTERWWVSGGSGPLPREQWQRLEAARHGKEHLVDNNPTDPPAISYELGRWEDDWRHCRGDMPAMASGSRALREAAKYLEIHMRWAGRQHPAFDEFLHDLHDLHARAAAAVGRAPVRPEDLDVACLDCGGPLQHPLEEVTAARDGLEWTGPVVEHLKVTCGACGASYDDRRFTLAQAETAARRSQVVLDGELYGQVTQVAHDLGRSRQTVYAWVQQGLARSWERRGLVFVHVDDAMGLHRERPARTARRAS